MQRAEKDMCSFNRGCLGGGAGCSRPGNGVLRHATSGPLVMSFLCALFLTACTPEPLVITRPVYIDRVQQVVQPIPAELLQPHAIAEGMPSQCPSIAAQRRAELDACNADKAAIRAIVEPAGQSDD